MSNTRPYKNIYIHGTPNQYIAARIEGASLIVATQMLRRIAPLMAAKKRVLRGAALEKEGGIYTEPACMQRVYFMLCSLIELV
jgi:hypothetical protein